MQSAGTCSAGNRGSGLRPTRSCDALAPSSAATYRPVVRDRHDGAHAAVPGTGRAPRLPALGLRGERAAAEPSSCGSMGPPGAGKTFLARRFLQEVRTSGAVALSGRCYERESVPYKAVDSLVDALSQFLRKLPAGRDAADPPGGRSGARPTLSGASARRGHRREQASRATKSPTRRSCGRLAFAAFRELLAHLAARDRLVLFIDDLQWGDADSAALLTDALRPPDSPPLLLITCDRTEGAATSPFLTKFLEGGEQQDTVAVREPVRRRARRRRRRGGSHSRCSRAVILPPARAPRRSHASRGQPPLPFGARTVQPGRRGGFRAAPPRTFGRGWSTGPSLEEILSERIVRLPDAARRLLEVLAVAGRPLRAPLARQAAEIGKDEGGALALLFSRHLVRSRSSDSRDEIEPYHDQIRETALASLSRRNAPRSSPAPGGSPGGLRNDRSGGAGAPLPGGGRNGPRGGVRIGRRRPRRGRAGLRTGGTPVPPRPRAAHGERRGSPAGPCP